MKTTIGILFAACVMLFSTAASAQCLFDCDKGEPIFFQSNDLKVPVVRGGVVMTSMPPIYEVEVDGKMVRMTEADFQHRVRALQDIEISKTLSTGAGPKPWFLGDLDVDRMIELSPLQLLNAVDTNYGRLYMDQVVTLRNYIARVAIDNISEAAKEGVAQVIPEPIRVKVEIGKLDITKPLKIEYQDGLSGRYRTNQGILTEVEVASHRRAFDEYRVRLLIKAQTRVNIQAAEFGEFIVALSPDYNPCSI